MQFQLPAPIKNYIKNYLDSYVSLFFENLHHTSTHYGINFSIYYGDDTQHGNFIYRSDDSNDKKTTLLISTQKKITWDKPNDLHPSENNCHFYLVVDGDLLNNYNAVNLDNKNWKISPSKSDKSTYFYYLNTQGGSLETERKLPLAMSNFFVASDYSGTSTSITFHLGNLVDGTEELNRTIRVEDSPSENVGGSSIPLVASWVSENTVLNDGNTNNSLTFSLSYPSSRTHTIINQNSNDPSSLKLSDKSQFILAFDYGDKNQKYALTTQDKLQAFEIGVSDNSHWEVTAQPNTQNPTHWLMKPKSDGLEFHAGTGFEITVNNIITDHTRGFTNLYLYYQDIPGYDDGEFILPINKTSVCVTEDGKVGIRAYEPQIDLAIGDNGTGLKNNDGNLALQANGKEGLRIDKDGNLGCGNLGCKDLRCENLSTLDYSMIKFGHTFGFSSTIKHQVADGLQVSFVDSGSLKIGSHPFNTDEELKQIMNVTGDGNVGIGTTTPEAKLHVDGGELRITNNDDHEQSKNKSWELGYVPYRSTSHRYTYVKEYPGYFYINDSRAATKCFVITNGGNVGIGTENPQAPLHIASGVSVGAGDYTYVKNDGNVHKFPRGNTYAASIKTDHNIVCAGEIWCTSDVRVKDIKGKSDAQKDLQTLNQLDVTDYNYIDVVSQGDRTIKKLVAQQVQELLPNAVTPHRSIIPSIYTPSKSINYDANKQQLTIQIEKPHQLKVDEKVRLIGDSKADLYPVVDVVDEFTFTVAASAPLEQVFVYGKEVDDCLTLDYDAVTALSVSAIQALYEKVTALEEANRELRERLEKV